jgi:hypothetical protein
MPSTYASEKTAILAANGGVDGKITLASNDGWLPGCDVRIISSTEPSLELVVVKQIGSTQVQCRRKDSIAKHGGGADLSDYLTADDASLNMEGQVVPVLAPFEPRERA